MASIAADYMAENAELLTFYARAPKELFAAAPRAVRWPEPLAEALAEYQERLGGRALFMGDEAVVVTGQQPGLFGGPLYTIYKAITAIILARRIHERFGVSCAPIFWVAGDDHDFEEARTAHLLTRSHEDLELSYAPEDSVDGLPMYRVPLEESLHGFIDEAAARAPGSEFREEVAAFLHESLDAAASLSDWCARILMRLFRETSLVMFSPHLPAAREVAAAVLEREIQDPLASTRLVNEAGERLRALGYPQQVSKGDTECCFFVEMGGRRRKVLYEDGRFCLPEEGFRCSCEDMLGLLRTAPERFSPNVALRCVVQQHLFPAAAYVAGPGEIAYWAQLKPLFEHFEEDMPVVYPRARCTLSSVKLNKLMNKLELSLADLTRDPRELVEQALYASSRAPAYEVVQRHRTDAEAALQVLTRELQQMNKPAAAMSRKIEGRVAKELDRLEQLILKGDDAHAEAVRKQIERLCTSLTPSRKPQERVYSIFSFLFDHGWGLIPRLMREIDIETHAMQEIEL